MVKLILSKVFWVVAATVLTASTVVYGQKVPCFFVFGDSISDSGNNNDLETAAKVNYKPYGIDFPKGPTGRFTNGRTIVDVIGQFSGFKEFIPSFAEASPEQAQIGLNYASGGGGLREETSEHLGGRISLRKQIVNHRNAIKKANVTTQRLQQCLYTFTIGSNDYLNNYFWKDARYDKSRLLTPHQYAYSLTIIYRSHLKSLQRLGMRKAVIFGLSQIGCTPRMMKSHGKSNKGNGKGRGNCADEVNEAVAVFNKNIADLVKDFNEKNTEGSKFTFVDLFAGGDPLGYSIQGFKVGDKGCCSLSPGGLCDPKGPVCENRKEYLFWDEVHSTEATNILVAKSAFTGLLTNPHSISELLKA